MLVRKNIYIEEKFWDLLDILKTSRKYNDKKISISRLIQEAVEEKLEKEKEDNFLLKMNMVAKKATLEEEKEVMECLSKLSEEDLKLSDRVVDLDF